MCKFVKLHIYSCTFCYGQEIYWLCILKSQLWCNVTEFSFQATSRKRHCSNPMPLCRICADELTMTSHTHHRLTKSWGTCCWRQGFCQATPSTGLPLQNRVRRFCNFKLQWTQMSNASNLNSGQKWAITVCNGRHVVERSIHLGKSFVPHCPKQSKKLKTSKVPWNKLAPWCSDIARCPLGFSLKSFCLVSLCRIAGLGRRGGRREGISSNHTREWNPSGGYA